MLSKEPRRTYGLAAAVLSIAIMAFILSFISLAILNESQDSRERTECLRPFNYEVDRTFGELLVVILDRNDSQYEASKSALKSALAARDSAVAGC